MSVYKAKPQDEGQARYDLATVSTAPRYQPMTPEGIKTAWQKAWSDGSTDETPICAICGYPWTGADEHGVMTESGLACVLRDVAVQYPQKLGTISST